MDRTFTRLLASWLALEWYSLCVSGLLQRLAGIAQKGADKQDIHMYIKVYTQVPDMPTINIFNPHTHIMSHRANEYGGGRHTNIPIVCTSSKTFCMRISS